MSSFKNREKGNPRRIQAYEYLVTNGLKPHLAAGVVGNLMQESFGNLDSTAVGDDGQSVGIAQWNGQRLVNLKRYAKKNKTSYKDFETQLGFLQQEINTTYDQGSSSWNKKQQANFFKAGNAEAAAEAFMINFERPSKGEVQNRKKYATKVFLETNDSNIYSQNSKGDIVSVDPSTASPEVIKNSATLQRQLYNTEFNKLSDEFKSASEANRAAEAKIKGYNESEELQRAKNEIKNKYNEELFMESLTYGNNNRIQTGSPIANTTEENETEEAAQTAVVETTGKNDLLAQAFKAPEQTPIQQQAPQQQGPDMYPGLETSDNEYYAAYLPEGFGDGGETGPFGVNPPVKQVKKQMSLADLEIDNKGDYRFIQPLEEVVIVGKSKITTDKAAATNSDYDRLSRRLNSSGINIKDAEIAATQKAQETTAVNKPTKVEVHRKAIPVDTLPQTTKLEKGSKGDDVVKLQELLIEQGFLNDEFGADGKFGKNTRAAVEAYQRSKGLKDDGIVGKNTLGAMKGLTPKMTELPTAEFLDTKTVEEAPKESVEEIPTKLGEASLINERQGVTRSVKDGRIQPVEQDVARKVFNKFPTYARTLINDVTNRAILGTDAEFNAITEQHFTEPQMDVMRNAVKTFLPKGEFAIDHYDKWRVLGMEGEEVQDGRGITNPISTVAWTLGKASFNIDKDGNVFVEDQYNFNDKSDNKDNPTENRYVNDEKSGDKWDEDGLLYTNPAKVGFKKAFYGVGRNAGTKWGSPDGKGAKVSILLGNIKDFGWDEAEQKKIMKAYNSKRT